MSGPTRMRELARLRVDTRRAADAIATSARTIGAHVDVEVRPAGAAGFVVVVHAVSRE